MNLNRNRKAFGEWLRKNRLKTGLSQDKVGKLLGYSMKTSLNRMENGYDSIPLEKLFDLAEIYGIEMDEIIEKLKEYDPDKAEKFDRLSEKFALYHLRSMQKAARSSFAQAGNPLHHAPFYGTLNALNEGFPPSSSARSSVDNSIYYQKLVM